MPLDEVIDALDDRFEEQLKGRAERFLGGGELREDVVVALHGTLGTCGDFHRVVTVPTDQRHLGDEHMPTAGEHGIGKFGDAVAESTLMPLVNHEELRFLFS